MRSSSPDEQFAVHFGAVAQSHTSARNSLTRHYVAVANVQGIGLAVLTLLHLDHCSNHVVALGDVEHMNTFLCPIEETAGVG